MQETPARIQVADTVPAVAVAALLAAGFTVGDDGDGIPADLAVLSLAGLRRLRQDGGRTPVVVVARSEDVVTAFTAGADDVVVRPVSGPELVARAHAILRRTRPSLALEPEQLLFGDLVLDAARHEVFRGPRAIDLTATEFRLLRYFMQNPRRVLSKGQILQSVWGADADRRSNVVETYVGYLRRKLDSAGPPVIQTVRQAGYMLDAE